MKTLRPKYFKTVFLEDAQQFLKKIDQSAFKKIMYNIEFAEQTCDSRLFKKLTQHIWEFRTLYAGLQYRFFAFWDKRSDIETLVIVSHGIIKKTDKVPVKEINKADHIRKLYFNDQNYHQ